MSPPSNINANGRHLRRGVGWTAPGGRSGLRARCLLTALADPRRRVLTLGWLGGRSSMLTDPRLHVLGVPHLAHAQLMGRLGKGWVGHDLLNPLPTQSAESFADLGGAHEVMHGGQHMHKTSGHLTSGQDWTRISHVTTGVSQLVRTPFAHDTCRHLAYAMTCEQYEHLLRRCGNRCQICGTPGGATPRTKLHIDHDCKVGQWAVRGLLCAYCNSHPYVLQVAARMPTYLAGAWYLELLNALGVGVETPPEPGLRAQVRSFDGRRWKHYARGWVWQNTSYHRAHIPTTWKRLVHTYGPHNLRVVGGRA